MQSARKSRISQRGCGGRPRQRFKERRTLVRTLINLELISENVRPLFALSFTAKLNRHQSRRVILSFFKWLFGFGSSVKKDTDLFGRARTIVKHYGPGTKKTYTKKLFGRGSNVKIQRSDGNVERGTQRNSFLGGKKSLFGARIETTKDRHGTKRTSRTSSGFFTTTKKTTVSGTCFRCDGHGSISLKCRSCEGSGLYTMDCHKCNGSGTFKLKCRKCHGSGEFHLPEKQCFRCHGKGCAQCGGSGIFKHAVNDACRNCDGLGFKPLPCDRCDTEGQITQQCRKCSGTGDVDRECNKCNGTGTFTKQYRKTRWGS